MNLFDISLRFILSKKQLSSTNISIVLSVTTFATAIAISLLVIGTSRSYSHNVEKEISNIYPDVEINNIMGSYLTLDECDSLIFNLRSELSGDAIITRYVKSNAMIKNAESSIGVIVYSFLDTTPDKIYNFKLHENLDSNYYPILSHYLYNKIENKNINIFNIEEMLENGVLKAINMEIASLYSTKINSFNKNVIFLDYSNFLELYPHEKDNFDGVIIENISDDEILAIKKIYNDKTKINKYNKFNVISWRESDNNSAILMWLNIFSNPIKLILVFVLLLSILYQISTTWLILYDKTNSFKTLRLLGVDKRILKKMAININFYLSIISLSLGVFFAYLLSYIQNKYQLYNLDSDIYIISELSSIILISDVTIILLLCIFIPLIFLRLLINIYKIDYLNVK